MKIGICAPSTPFSRDDAAKVIALAAKSHPEAELIFHDQCFGEDGHFAGSDEVRLAAFLEMANDPELGAIWFARGGYGACRIADEAAAKIGEDAIMHFAGTETQQLPFAPDKIYMGYSDAGNILAMLYNLGIGQPVHGPMPTDIRRKDGKVAIRRALGWLVDQDNGTLESSLMSGEKYVAFNAMTLSMMVGTPIMPDLSGHILMIEEVSEYLYAFDRAMFHITGNLRGSMLTGIQLGRVSDIPENDRPFSEDAEAITKRWCAENGIDYLGKADIGHDIGNKIVPFGKA